MHDIWLKVIGHPYNAVVVPGRVGMEECSLDLIFLKIRDRPFVFLVEAGAVFSDSLNVIF